MSSYLGVSLEPQGGSAISLVESVRRNSGAAEFHVRHLERVADPSYTETARGLRALGECDVGGKPLHRATMAILEGFPWTITLHLMSSTNLTAVRVAVEPCEFADEHYIKVTMPDLVATLRLILGDRLKISEALPGAQALLEALAIQRGRIVDGNTAFREPHLKEFRDLVEEHERSDCIGNATTVDSY